MSYLCKEGEDPSDIEAVEEKLAELKQKGVLIKEQIKDLLVR